MKGSVMSQSQFRVPKRERSPTPPIGSILPRQITSGSKRIAPVPPTCAKDAPRFAEERKAWARREGEKLKALGLTITKVFLRDDGLVLDWESRIPVWADTLLPVTTAQVSSDDIETDLQMEDSSTHPQPQHEEVQTSDVESTELEDRAVEYINRYVRTFDTDRTALSSAYVRNATFSYCLHDIISPNSLAAAFTNYNEIHRFASRKGSRNLLKVTSDKNISRGRSEIITTLQSLGPHKFCAYPSAKLDYDVLHLPGTPLVLLICNGFIFDERKGRQHRLSVHQSFILQKALDQGPSCANWPLVALSHQMSVRDLSSVPTAI